MLRLALRRKPTRHRYTGTWVSILSRVFCAFLGKIVTVRLTRFPSTRAQLAPLLLASPFSVTAWATLAALLRHRVFELSSRNFLGPSGMLAVGAVLQRMTVLRLPHLVTALKSLFTQSGRVVWNLRSPPLMSTLALPFVGMVLLSYPRNPISVILLCRTVVRTLVTLWLPWIVPSKVTGECLLSIW